MVLKSMPYAQAKVIATDNGYILISYKTTVARLADGWVEVYGLYSRTTCRHIGAFMREYCHADYYTAKRLYQEGLKLNIETGEVVEI